MPIHWSDYSLDELRAHAVHTYRAGGGSRPDVLLIEIKGERAVLKDQNGADKWFATIIGPILNWRECKALTKLSTLDFIPDLLHRPDVRSFLMSHHDSEQITRLNKFTPEWSEFFQHLSSAIEQMHKAGVAHNDLRNPTNTLVTAEGKPILVDLVACFCRGQSWNIVNNWLFDRFCQVDLSAIAKIKSRVATHLLTEHEIQPEQIAGRAGMAARSLGQFIRRLSRRIFTK